MGQIRLVQGFPKILDAQKLSVRAPRFASSFGISLAPWKSNPDVLSSISKFVFWMRKRAPSDSNLRLFFVHPYRCITLFTPLACAGVFDPHLPVQKPFPHSTFTGGSRGAATLYVRTSVCIPQTAATSKVLQSKMAKDAVAPVGTDTNLTYDCLVG